MTRFEYGEIRIYAIGVVNGIEITLIYAEVSDHQRKIVLAWRAKRHEREAYWKAIG